MKFIPDITIVIPVYERYDYFESAIASAINQTVQCNILVVDNCSSHSKFKTYLEANSLPFIKYYRNDYVLPMVSNWNQCLNLCSTTWFTMLHDDDLLAPDFIKVVSKLIDDYPGHLTYMVNFVVGEEPKDFVEKSNASIQQKVKKYYPENFIFGNITAFPGVLFNLKDSGQMRFDETTYPVQDYDLWYRLSKLKPIVYSKRILAFYRISSAQASANTHQSLLEAAYDYVSKKIGFKNRVYKFFALYTLYRTHLIHKKIYKSSYTTKFNASDLNKYFSFFSNSIVTFFMPLFDLVFRIFFKLNLFLKYS